MDASDALLAARDLIREHGLALGAYINYEGSLCLGGALTRVLNLGSRRGSAVPANSRFSLEKTRAWQVLGEVCQYDYGEPNPMHVNDDLNVDSACELLERAAKWASE